MDGQSSATLAGPVAHPPETAEGWFALHQVLRFDWTAWRRTSVDDRVMLLGSLDRGWRDLSHRGDAQGWSAIVRLVSSTSDLMVLHLRPTLDELADARLRFARIAFGDLLSATYTFLSVTEVSLYHITAKAVDDAQARGGTVGDAAYQAMMADRAQRELASPHVTRRLYPALPADMPYVSFYPMSKRRTGADNWYELPIGDRDRLMQHHGLTGRKYAGRISQIVTGATGFDRWEWGVTLFAKDPVDLKRIVTEMRYDEASARYAEFGEFFAGKVCSVEELSADIKGT